VKLVIGLVAIGVDDRVQRGLASGGEAPADSLAVAISRIAPAVQVLGDPRRGGSDSGSCNWDG